MATVLALFSQTSVADQWGVSFWLPGTFGSLAAVPQQQPGWAFASVYYHTSVSAGGDVALSREFEILGHPVAISGTANASLNAKVDMDMINSTYAFAAPVLGGQFAVGLMGLYGRNDTTIAGTFTGTANGNPFTLSGSREGTLWGFGDLYPQASIKWNKGTDNWMVYIMGDVPVGAYSSRRLANMGLGHGAIDGGVGYTYFNPQNGHEFSAVLGLTGNFDNTATNYTSGVDMHLDWGASQFLTKQTQIGLVGYVYKQISCDSGSGDRIAGCFESQVIGIGPQIGYIFPINKDLQGYVNLKGYREFDKEHRPDGWNAWLTFAISPAAPTPPAAKTRMITK